MNNTHPLVRQCFGAFFLAAAVVAWEPAAGSATPPPPTPPAAPPVPTTASRATPPPAQNKGALIEFKERKFDFGKVPAGQEVRHDYTFRNAGDAPLEILSVRTSCGCTTTSDYPRLIPPGGEGRIPVILKTTGFSGKLHKTITVTSNSAKDPVVMLELTGEAWVPVQVTPSYLYFSRIIGQNQTETKVARLVNQTDRPMVIFSTEVSPAEYKVEVKPVVEGREYFVEVTPTGHFAAGSSQATIVLKTSLTESPEVRLPVYVNVLKPVLATPSHLILPSGALPAPTKRFVSIRANDSRPLRVTEVRLEGTAQVQTKVTEILQSKMFRIEVTFPAGFELPRGQTPELVIHTDRPDYREIKVPIVQPASPSGVTVRRTTPVVRPATPTPRPDSSRKTVHRRVQPAVPLSPPEPPAPEPPPFLRRPDR